MLATGLGSKGLSLLDVMPYRAEARGNVISNSKNRYLKTRKLVEWPNSIETGSFIAFDAYSKGSLIEVIGCVDKGAETCTGVYVTNRKVSVFLEGNDLVEEIIPPTAWSTNSWPATEEDWTLKLGNTHPSFIPFLSAKQ